MNRLAAMLLLLGAAPLAAQDGIRVGFTYSPGVRPGIVVVADPGLDSVRKIVERDLQYTDLFSVANLPDTAGRLGGAVNLDAYRLFDAQLLVELRTQASGVEFKVHDLAAKTVRQQGVRAVDRSGAGAARMAIHRLSDEISKGISGVPGIAATRILYKSDARTGVDDGLWMVDADGENASRVVKSTGIVQSPVWHPDATRIAFTEMKDHVGAIILMTLGTGTRTTVPTTTAAMNFSLAFAPGGESATFARATEDGTDLFRVDIARRCCVSRLTNDRKLADNLSPTYSPDGRTIAFVSSAGGRPQIYAVDADGTNRRLLVPDDYGNAGESQAPEWSPDGTKIAFHRDVTGGRQIHVFDVARGTVRAVTSAGRNEDASWAPDSRHLVFKSNRSGRDQLMVLDVESSTLRPIRTPGLARVPAWSPSLGTANP